MGFAKQWKGVNGYMIKDPGEFFTNYNESHGVGYPIAFMFVSFIAVMLPLATLSVVANITDPGGAVVGAGIILGLGIIFWVLALVEGLLAHGIVYLFGARDVATTFEAYAFPTVVRYGLWWIPIVNIVLGFYGLYLQIRGLAEFHDISTGKAAVAAICAAFLSTPAVLLLIAVIGAFVLNLGESAAQPAMILFEAGG